MLRGSKFSPLCCEKSVPTDHRQVCPNRSIKAYVTIGELTYLTAVPPVVGLTLTPEAVGAVRARAMTATCVGATLIHV